MGFVCGLYASTEDADILVQSRLTARRSVLATSSERCSSILRNHKRDSHLDFRLSETEVREGSVSGKISE